MNPEGGANHVQAERQPSDMGREQLSGELDKARADLEDLYELRHGFLGQTGVHIGAGVLNNVRRQFEREEARLKERIALLEELLRRGVNYDRGER